MECKFRIVGEINTKQRPRATVQGGHARVYTPSATINYENYIKSEYQRQCPDVHFGDKPLIATVFAYFKPAGELSKFESEAYRVACLNKKDCDNIAKTVLDALNGIAYNDDRQIVQLEIAKNYCNEGEPEYIEVRIAEMKIFNTIEDLKREKEMKKLEERYYELKSKEKLTKAERERLEEITAKLKEWYGERLFKMYFEDDEEE